MQPHPPIWKIPTRPCPFYSQGKCIFSKNCSFLHQVKATPTVVRVTAPEGQYSVAPDSTLSVTTPKQLSEALLQHESSYADRTVSQQPDLGEDTDPDSPTIRKFPAVKRRDSEANPSRDSVATVKGESHGSRSASHTSMSYSPPPKFYVSSRSETADFSAFSTPPRNDSGEVLESPFSETVAVMHVPRANTPSSATSATAQEVEVPVLTGSARFIPPFTLADAGSSSLLANRLAKSRSPPSPPVSSRDTSDASSPFSAGALYASYHEEDTGFLPAYPPIYNALTGAASEDHVSPTPQAIPKTPSWLRPLRLASALTSQTGSLSSISQFTDVSLSQSLSATSTPPSVSPGLMYDSPLTRESPKELSRTSSPSSQAHPILIDTPHTLVLSDHDGYVSPLLLSRNGSLDIDMSGYPPPPASSSGNSIHDSSSPASISFSELTGRSPNARPVAPSMPIVTPSVVPESRVGTFYSLSRPTTPAEQLRSALDRRARRMREGSQLMVYADIQGNIPDLSFSASDSQTLFPNSTLSTSLAESLSMSDFPRSQSWSTLSFIDSLSHTDIQPTTSASDSLLLQQAQSSPPRSSPHLRLTPALPTSSFSHGTVPILAPSPDPSPRPHLLFAIASDQPAEVERLLSTGECSANETTSTGTGLLEFTVANEGLKNKTEIVKTLLKYGADPGPLKNCDDAERSGQSPGFARKVEEGLNPALKYYLSRPQSLDVDSAPALEALQQSSFAPLARARFDIIGQDRVLDEFYRVLGMHSQRKGRNALVILLCGASGHGKSLLAQKVGSLLDAPTHTINMTALRSQHDLWQCLSTGMEDASPDLDLAEFLVENQGKRCVIVLDEIEKVDDPKALNPLLLPWDIGRCSLEQKRHTDTSQVIWIATSNLGQRLISEHIEQWSHPDSPPTRTEYTQLATAIRRGIAEVLGASLLSRVTAVLPFLPFTFAEKVAIGTEAALSHREFVSGVLSADEMEAMVRQAVRDVNFVEEEGARSLYRIVETHLLMRI